MEKTIDIIHSYETNEQALEMDLKERHSISSAKLKARRLAHHNNDSYAGLDGDDGNDDNKNYDNDKIKHQAEHKSRELLDEFQRSDFVEQRELAEGHRLAQEKLRSKRSLFSNRNPNMRRNANNSSLSAESSPAKRGADVNRTFRNNDVSNTVKKDDSSK